MASDNDRSDEETQEVSPEPIARTADDVIREQQASHGQAAGGQEPPPGASQPSSPGGPPWQQPTQDQQWLPQQAQHWQQPQGQPWQQPQQWQQPQGQPWQQPPPGWTPQQGWGGYAQQPAYGSSVMVIIAGIVLIVVGVLITLIGLFGVLIGGFVEEVLRQVPDPTIPLQGLGQLITVIFGVLLVVGVLHIVSSIGIFLHRTWGRLIGILLAVLGTLLWVLGVVGSMQMAPATFNGGQEAFLPIVLAVAYGYTLFALIAGGHHFRRRWG